MLQHLEGAAREHGGPSQLIRSVQSCSATYRMAFMTCTLDRSFLVTASARTGLRGVLSVTGNTITPRAEAASWGVVLLPCRCLCRSLLIRRAVTLGR